MAGHLQALQASRASLGDAQIRVLERIATGAPLSEILDDIVRLVEAQSVGAHCTILLLDGRSLRHGAAPSLPAEYARAIDGQPIGPEEGSCGAAAFHRKRVIVADILSHPNWASYRELASTHGLRACWSSPIFSAQREVLGTFAIYHGESGEPSREELEWVDIATHTAAIAIARDRSARAQAMAEARVQQLARLYAVSSSVNETLLRVRDPNVLFEAACLIAVEGGLAALAWIGFYDETTDLIQCAASFGQEAAEYVKAIRLRLRDETTSRGPAAKALRTGSPAVANDVASDPEFYWREEALRRGLRSCAVFPLSIRGRPPGVFAIYGSTVGFFREEEIAVLNILTGNIAFAVESARAAEELREREDRLQHSEAELRMASQAARVGGWSVELPQRKVGWSEQLFTIHELPVGSPPAAVHALASCAPEFLETAKRVVEACIRDGTAFDDEIQIITATGKRVWVRAIGHAERDASGKVVGLRGALQDIDDRRRLEDQLRQSQKMDAIGQLAGGVAHDFNNVLSVILSYASFIIDGLAPDDALREDVEQIRIAGVRATELTRQLLTFSRQQPLDPRLLDLNEVLSGFEKMLRRLVGEHVTLTVIPGEGLGRVVLDPGHVEQVIMNLAVNARDAMPGGGMLTIETSIATLDSDYAAEHPGVIPGDYVSMAVTDTGHGMDAATRARIFEPFFTTKPKGKGTGIGLATVYGIVAQSGGHISVESEPRAGATFRVYLPRRTGAPSARISVGPRRPSARGVGQTVLVVEDDEQVRVAIVAILRRAGYNVLEATNGADALIVSEQYPGRVHLLLCDVVMPRLSGPELARRLCATRSDMQVLHMSGYSREDLVVHGIPADGPAPLAKPLTPEMLVAATADLLDASTEPRSRPSPDSRVPRPTAARAEHVLHIDHEEALVVLTGRFLKRLGYRVTGFTDPHGALRAFQARPDDFDALITDITMSTMSGFDLVRAIRRTRADLPIVVMSGYFRAEDLREADALGLRSLLVKPDTVDELGQVLHEEIERHTGAA